MPAQRPFECASIGVQSGAHAMSKQPVPGGVHVLHEALQQNVPSAHTSRPQRTGAHVRCEQKQGEPS